jgi:hypothetical protein
LTKKGSKSIKGIDKIEVTFDEKVGQIGFNRGQNRPKEVKFDDKVGQI